MKKLPYLFFSLASVLTALGKTMVERHLPVDYLSLPGWFIVGDLMVQVRKVKSKLLANCLEYTEYSMPASYKKDLKKLIEKIKREK